MKFKIFEPLLLAALVVPALVGRASAAPFTTTPLRVMTVGDSITASFRYQPFLRTKMTNEGLNFTLVGSKGTGPDLHEGINGDSVAGVSNRVSSAITNSNANVVMLQVGINDMGHGWQVGPSTDFPPYNNIDRTQAARPGATLASIYKSDLYTTVPQMLDTILDHPNAPILIVAKIPGIGLGNPNWQSENNDCDARVKEYNAILETEVKTRQNQGKKIRLVNNYALGNRYYGPQGVYTWGTQSEQTSDWVHPHAGSTATTAYEGMATNFFNGLQSIYVTNLITNPSFDAENFNTQTPSGWSEWEGDANSASIPATSSYTETYLGAYNGARHATHYKNAAYRVYTYQTKTTLVNGKYTLRAYARRGGSQTYCHMEAKGFDSTGTKKTVNIPSSGEYKLIEIKDIEVTNGNCTIGFWSQTNTGAYAFFDDVSFFKQP